jgi:hypothetical protein
MRYYIVDCNGTTHGEAGEREKAEALMHDIFSDAKIKEKEIEIIEG